MKKGIGIVCTLFCISIACEKSIEVELPPVEEKIGILGFFMTTEPISLIVSHSKHIFDTTKTFHLENVVVDFYENDVFIETFENKGLRSIGLNFISPSGFLPVKNNSYSIVITAADFKTAFATNTLPEPVPILSIDTFSVTAEIYDWYDIIFKEKMITKPVLECRILFRDPPDISNYYCLHVGRIDYSSDEVPYFCNDPILEFYEVLSPRFDLGHYCHYEYFSDSNIDGENYELVVLLDKSYVRYIIYFKLLSLSEDYYFYKKSISQNTSQNYKILYDPFREADQGYTNVRNGVGIFAGASVSVDSIVIQ